MPHRLLTRQEIEGAFPALGRQALSAGRITDLAIYDRAACMDRGAGIC